MRGGSLSVSRTVVLSDWHRACCSDPSGCGVCMAIDRRTFLRLSAGTVAASTALSAHSTSASRAPWFEGIAFDAFPIFDPRPIAARAEEFFPGKGSQLSDLWRTRQFEYQWLRTLSGQYADFWQTTDEALVFAARLLRLELSVEKRSALMRTYHELKPWPDAVAVLRSLQRAGIRLAFLSNMTATMLENGLVNARLVDVFEYILTTDRVRRHKPDSRAYEMATAAFKLPRERILFVAFAGWDVAGAKWFGYPTYWVNRLNLPAEELGVGPDGQGKTLEDLLTFLATSP
jgi:2-haloacid dehalogenase